MHLFSHLAILFWSKLHDKARETRRQKLQKLKKKKVINWTLLVLTVSTFSQVQDGCTEGSSRHFHSGKAIIGKLSVNSCQTVVFFVLDHFLM